MFEVLRSFPEFRKLWLAQVASQGGDWLSRVAVVTLIGELSGASAAVGIGLLYGVELALRWLPSAVLGPIAGPVADRLPRRALMIGADLMRAALVLALLAIDDPSDLPLLYTIVALQMGTGIFFDSAKSGVLPNTVPRESLHTAYALSAATWSSMLAVGSLVGGFLLEWTDVETVFIVDAFTYLFSAALVFRIRLLPTDRESPTPLPFHWSDIVLFKDLRRGFEHVREKGLLAPVLAKTFWGPAGGFLVLLSIVASDRFGNDTAGGSTGFAVGVLFSARGVGTALGPIFGRAFVGSSDAMLRKQIAIGYALGALGYALFAFTESMLVAYPCIVLSHMGGSGLWVASTTLWQKHVDDAYRGRVFALEFLGMTTAFTLAGLATGLLYDWNQRIDVTTWTVCGAVTVMGSTWIYLTNRKRAHRG